MTTEFSTGARKRRGASVKTGQEGWGGVRHVQDSESHAARKEVSGGLWLLGGHNGPRRWIKQKMSR